MPEPLSIVVASAWLGTSALNAYARQRSAFSQTAFVLENEVITLVMNPVEESQVLFGRKSAAISLLKQVAAECIEVDWDGCGAVPVDEIAIQNAEAFVRAMPDGMAMPELSPEPDGAISFDWMVSKYRLFSVSVGTDNRLAYAWLDGAEKGHAVAVFDGQTIPAKVRAGIDSIIAHANDAIRVA